MVVYNLYILGKNGQSLFYREWLREQSSNLSRDEEDKLMVGLLFSLSNFAKKMSSTPGSGVFKSFKVNCNLLTIPHFYLRHQSINFTTGKVQLASSLC
jgi:hypothetical protein